MINIFVGQVESCVFSGLKSEGWVYAIAVPIEEIAVVFEIFIEKVQAKGCVFVNRYIAVQLNLGGAKSVCTE